MKEFTAQQMTDLITERYGRFALTVIPQVNGWLARGDGIAAYVNQDLGFGDLGDLKLTSYGSAAAQIEFDTVPVTLPDGIGGTINWRYRLEGIYRGDVLPVPPEDSFPPEEYPGITADDTYWEDDENEDYRDDYAD